MEPGHLDLNGSMRRAITSYSIHYTKLCELGTRGSSRVDLQACKLANDYALANKSFRVEMCIRDSIKPLYYALFTSCHKSILR